ncbi:AT hook, DNA-binding motif-containing protein [Artemisia annua]|uniref:AT hook, DNA-binding motif-containing protein n=1 Tax=Artemisia annua TaxID=35608 RepID=A0A2U1L5B9_ARTAN|nr:AT hook, DNA-binding motif-containing protein [Artemisia annua]
MENLQIVPLDDGNNDDEDLPSPGNEKIRVAKFDYSYENYFKVMNKMLEISGEDVSSQFELNQSEFQRMSSSLEFIRDWRHFCSKPQAIRFARQRDTSERKDITERIKLTQFSSAAVPKDTSDGNKASSHLSEDFVMYVGGPVWALDWCPRVHQPDCDVNLEFVAIAAHPPESSYNKVGSALTGRGVIQIWGLLNPHVKDHDVFSQVKKKSKKNLSNKTSTPEGTPPKKPRGRPRKESVSEEVAVEDNDKNVKQSAPKKPRGRPKKELEDNFDCSNKHLESLAIISNDDSAATDSKEFSSAKPYTPIRSDGKKRTKKPLYGDSQYVEPISMKFPEDSSILQFDETSLGTKNKSKYEAVDDSNCSTQHVQDPVVQLAEDFSDIVPEALDKVVPEKASSRKRKGYEKQTSVKSALTSKSRLAKCKLNSESQDPMGSCATGYSVPLETDPDSCDISEDISLPRLVMCLAHNGKVAWDIKWRPVDTSANLKHRMGYLGVLLGSGALEVWEVPLPHAAEAMFSACQKDGTDPRFIKLKPVFRCAMLKCGDRQSIPLTMEWSTASPHDLILAGCHDGMVALWKFSANSPLKDTKPLIFFSADILPIRALAWAPVACDFESANIIVTAGHKGVKFWDIRDPFRPLWDVNPVQRVIYGVDWLSDPRCVVLSFDDGEIRIISLSKAACDVPVTGKPFVGTQLQGLNSYHCSSSSIWSVQVSKLTGMVAYCCSDGRVLRFQLTAKSVEKDPRRNREPHYLCGALTTEGSTLNVFSPLPDELGETPRSRRGHLTISNQEKRAREQGLKCQMPEDQAIPQAREQGLRCYTPEEQPLALCYNNDPGVDSGSDDTMVAQKSKTSKTKGTSKKKPKADAKQAFTSTDEVPDVETINEKEVFPSKIVAMHRVRWNMNKGSERWLCYGGAAGIVRCQEISLG